MSTQTPPAYGPLTNQVWQQAVQALAWFQAVLASPTATASPASIAAEAALIVSTLLSGAEVLAVASLVRSLTAQLPGLQTIAALPAAYSTSQTAAINARIQSIGLLGPTLADLLPAGFPTSAGALLNLGQPAIASPGSLAVLAGWQAETPPTYYMPGAQVLVTPLLDGLGNPILDGLGNPILITTPGGLPGSSAQNLADWTGIAVLAAAYYGARPAPALDAAIQTAQGAALQSAAVSGLPIQDVASPAFSAAQDWNQGFALPATLAAARLAHPDLSLSTAQSAMAARAFFLAMAMQLSQVALQATGLAATAGGQTPTTAVVLQGQGLMDIAAGQAGGFEFWQTLTSGLPPPWGAGSLAPGTSVSLTAGSAGLTQARILGTDINLGQQGQDLPPWSGDYQTLVGISNYRAALGRRLATTLGGLVFHQQFGSRIPPEIGQIMTIGSAALISTYGQQALASDPRTQAILAVSATSVSGVPNAIAFAATVQPAGPGLLPIAVDAVLAG